MSVFGKVANSKLELSSRTAGTLLHPDLATALRLCSAEMGEQVGQPLKGHTELLRCLVISLNGKTIASGSNDYTVRLWSTETGAQIGQPLEASVPNLSFSLDAKVRSSLESPNMAWDLTSTVPNPSPEVLSHVPSRSVYTVDEQRWVRSDGKPRLFWLSVNLRRQITHPSRSSRQIDTWHSPIQPSPS